MFDDIIDSASDTAKTVRHVAELEVEKVKLDVAEGLSTVSVKAVSAVVKLVLIFNVVFFFAMGLAFLLNGLIDIPGIGFFIIGALFVLVLVFFAVFRRRIIERPVVRMYIDLLFKK